MRSAGKNMKSALDHPEVVSDYIVKEVAAGSIMGPLWILLKSGVGILVGLA